MENENEYKGYYFYNCDSCKMSGALHATNLAEAKRLFMERHNKFLHFHKISCDNPSVRIRCPNDRVAVF